MESLSDILFLLVIATFFNNTIPIAFGQQWSLITQSYHNHYHSS